MDRKAPCGHTGEVVFGNYVACRLCDQSDGVPIETNSDGVPEYIDEDRVTEPLPLPVWAVPTLRWDDEQLTMAAVLAGTASHSDCKIAIPYCSCAWCEESKKDRS
jgi:hypothetical protein